jgi:hypothetical protein
MRSLVVAALVLCLAWPVLAQEGVFLSEGEAPSAVFPEANRFERQSVDATAALRADVQQRLDGVTPSLWEERYVFYRALSADGVVGYALFVDEVGKHMPISFVIGLRPDGKVADVAVVAYREAYGGDVRQRRFLAQYQGKGPDDPVRPYREIKNVAGATLSVEAASRAVRKAQAIAAALRLTG